MMLFHPCLSFQLNYDLDTAIGISIVDADGLSASGTIILDVTPVNEAPTAVNIDQTLTFNEDASATTLATIVISENDTIKSSSDSTTASDDTTPETVTVTIALSDSSAGSFSADTGSGESFFWNMVYIRCFSDNSKHCISIIGIYSCFKL